LILFDTIFKRSKKIHLYLFFYPFCLVKNFNIYKGIVTYKKDFFYYAYRILFMNFHEQSSSSSLIIMKFVLFFFLIFIVYFYTFYFLILFVEHYKSAVYFSFVQVVQSFRNFFERCCFNINAQFSLAHHFNYAFDIFFGSAV